MTLGKKVCAHTLFNLPPYSIEFPSTTQPCLKSNPQCGSFLHTPHPRNSESERAKLGSPYPGACRVGRPWCIWRRAGEAALARLGADRRHHGPGAGFAQERAPPRPPAAPPRPGPGSSPARHRGLTARQAQRSGASGEGEQRPRRPGGPAGCSQGDRGGGGQGACALQGRQIWREGECPKLFV
jgi:hypothetical protein